MTVPAVPEGQFVDIGNGLQMHYHESGDGPAVIYVHGSGPGASGWSNFKGNYDVLGGAGFRAIVPDLLGYGYSSMTAEAKFTFEDLRDGILAMADALGLDRFSLVGNSMGGAMTVQLAADHPDRVERLVLMAPGGLESRETYMEMKGIRTMIRAMYDPEGINRDSMRKVFGLQLFNSDLVTDEIIEERFQIAELQPRGMFEKLVVPSVIDDLERIECPVLGFWGVNDQFCPVSGATTVASRCRNVKMTMISECGHWVMVEHADYFNRQLIDFLRGDLDA